MFNGLKYISLFVLVIQNCWLAFVMKFSKSNDGPEYNSKTAVILSEFLKLVLSILVLTTTNKFSSRRELVKELKKDSLKLMVPTVLYLLQNNLQYYAVSKLDPTLFQITYQIKIFTTAFFSMLILKKKLNFNQIVALIVLMIGVVLVQFDDDEVGEESLIKNLNNSSDFWNFNDRFLGLIAVLVSCILSGLAGVWFEMYKMDFFSNFDSGFGGTIGGTGSEVIDTTNSIFN
ncbi:hypothetical protein HDU92_001020 [Lobulomyces angularis]|nr:hypothetical protein HDU92_001020 [Lobulomyces angularis]